MCVRLSFAQAHHMEVCNKCAEPSIKCLPSSKWNSCISEAFTFGGFMEAYVLTVSGDMHLSMNRVLPSTHRQCPSALQKPFSHL